MWSHPVGTGPQKTMVESNKGKTPEQVKDICFPKVDSWGPPGDKGHSVLGRL
jgi:hypothetical protein